jgi:hypothetical protein
MREQRAARAPSPRALLDEQVVEPGAGAGEERRERAEVNRKADRMNPRTSEVSSGVASRIVTTGVSGMGPRSNFNPPIRALEPA